MSGCVIFPPFFLLVEIKISVHMPISVKPFKKNMIFVLVQLHSRREYGRTIAHVTLKNQSIYKVRVQFYICLSSIIKLL